MDCFVKCGTNSYHGVTLNLKLFIIVLKMHLIIYMLIFLHHLPVDWSINTGMGELKVHPSLSTPIVNRITTVIYKEAATATSRLMITRYPGFIY